MHSKGHYQGHYKDHEHSDDEYLEIVTSWVKNTITIKYQVIRWFLIGIFTFDFDLLQRS